MVPITVPLWHLEVGCAAVGACLALIGVALYHAWQNTTRRY